MSNGTKELHTSPITMEDEIKEFSNKPVKSSALYKKFGEVDKAIQEGSLPEATGADYDKMLILNALGKWQMTDCRINLTVQNYLPSSSYQLLGYNDGSYTTNMKIHYHSIDSIIYTKAMDLLETNIATILADNKFHRFSTVINPTNNPDDYDDYYNEAQYWMVAPNVISRIAGATVTNVRIGDGLRNAVDIYADLSIPGYGNVLGHLIIAVTSDSVTQTTTIYLYAKQEDSAGSF